VNAPFPNPLDLRGPDFLLFYTALALVTLAAVRLAQRWRESRPETTVRLSDPYLIAFLRGGEDEALRVAALSLLDRGLLTARDPDLGTHLQTKGGAEAIARVTHPLERAVLECFTSEARADTLFEDPGVHTTTVPLRQELERHGLVADDEVRRWRFLTTLAAIGLLWAVALVKVYLALTHGRTNVWFLVVLAAALALFAHYSPLRTAAGDRVLADLRTLFGGLRQRRVAVGAAYGAEVPLLGAVFGLQALPDDGPWWPIQGLKKPKPERDSDGSWWGGSSCGSSGGSTCGGGAGCGGCGGCGG
jgi:uncharacterized protein (TIGR04222 family)